MREPRQAAEVRMVAAGRLGPGVQGARLRRRRRHPVSWQRRHDGDRPQHVRLQPAVLPVHARPAGQHRQHLLLARRLRLRGPGDGAAARRLRAGAVQARPGGVDPREQQPGRLGGARRALDRRGVGRRRADAGPDRPEPGAARARSGPSRTEPEPDPEPDPEQATRSSPWTSGRSSARTGYASARTPTCRW